eukprot:6212252-Pleurochrysis_carterae.AAC.3
MQLALGQVGVPDVHRLAAVASFISYWDGLGTFKNRVVSVTCCDWHFYAFLSMQNGFATAPDGCIYALCNPANVKHSSHRRTGRFHICERRQAN